MDAADFLLALYPAPLASVAQREALAALVAYTQRVMQDFNDPCHDFQHVCRVVKLALQIASEEFVDEAQSEKRILVFLAALTHDVGDHKFEGGESRKASAAALLARGWGCAVSRAALDIGGKISWSKEQRLIASGAQIECAELRVLEIVQDADRLDAIGAVGVARCFAFGGFKNRALAASREHFDEKLLKMSFKTATGKSLGAKRHAAMRAFIDEFDFEMKIKA